MTTQTLVRQPPRSLLRPSPRSLLRPSPRYVPRHAAPPARPVRLLAAAGYSLAAAAMAFGAPIDARALATWIHRTER